MARSVVVACCLWLLLAVTQQSHAILENQAGTYDWHRQMIGAAGSVVFDSDNRQVIVAAEHGVLAAVGSSGQLAWRNVMRERDILNGMALVEDSLLTLNGDSKLRRWDPKTGDLMWEVALGRTVTVPLPSSDGGSKTWGNSASPAWTQASDLQPASKGLTVVLVNDTVHLVNAVSGEAKWTATLDLSDGQVYKQLALSGQQIFAVGSHKDSVAVAELKLQSGEVANTKTIDLPAADCRCSGSAVMCIGSDGTIKAASLNGESKGSHNLKPGAKFAPYSGTQASVFAFTSGGQDVLISLTKGGVNVVKSFATTGAYSLSELDGTAFISRVSITNNQYSVEVLGTDGSVPTDFKASAPISLPTNVAAPHLCWAQLLTRKSGGFGAFAVTRTVDNTLVAVRADKLIWQRDEGLSAIHEAEFINLPPKSLSDAAGYTSKNPFHHYVSRLTSRVTQLKNLVVEAETVLVGATDGDDTVYRDLFNEHKYIVTLSSYGTLAALDTWTGEAVWRSNPSLGDIVTARLVVLRKTSHGVPICAVFASTSAGSVIHTFNPLTGQPVDDLQSTTTLSTRFDMVAPLSLETSATIRVIALILENEEVELFPSTSETVSLVNGSPKPLHVFAISKERGTMTGYQLVSGGKGVALQSLWQLQLAGPHAHIEAVAFRNSHEKISSLGEVLSDGNVMYKYLNPNQVTVATLSDYIKGAAILTVYVVDAVKGRLIEKVFHENVVGPVHLTQSEHWVAYHYRNRKAKRFEINIMEMYESNNKPRTDGFSSLDSALPIVMSQSYVLPTAITATASSVTEHGITGKMLIAATPSGQVVGYPRTVVNARRPMDKKPTPGGPVGLPPYYPILPMEPIMNLNYDLNIQRVRAIETCPSGLESTSLVFAHGLDIFYSKVFPSKKFDVLNEDFNHPALALTVAGLGILTYVLSTLSSRANTAERWK